MENLAGKRVLTFGDSIIDGHLYKKAGFMEFVAEQEGMTVRKYANNGACVMPGHPVDENGLGGMILEDQIEAAARAGEQADYIVFDGGTNDAYPPVMEKLGDVSADRGETDTFAGAFRRTVEALRRYWPEAVLVYVAVHRLGYRERYVQEALRRIVLNLCAESGVIVADLYGKCELDTSVEQMCRKYSFDTLVDGLPAPGENPTGTHPNLEAIRKFYLPFVSEVLRKAEVFRFREVYTHCFEDEIVLYWELPEGAVCGQTRYSISVDGVKVGETTKSHFSLKHLAPETVYEVELQAVHHCAAECRTEESRTKESRTGGCRAAENRIEKEPEERMQAVTVICETQKVRTRLDVTADPYGAVGDGVTMNTAALQRALDACGPEQTVYIPAGIYLTGALRLHSRMELYLEEGAVLKGTAVPEDYLPRIRSRFEGREMKTFSGLLNLGELDHKAGPTSENVAIRGKGCIEGGGRPLMERVIEEERVRLKEYLEELGEKILECENLDTIPGRVRPRLLHICNARNVVISGITLKNGASWNVHMIYSENILTYGCRFVSRNVWNGDGWDPDSSRNCTIFGCTFDTGDDAIAIKSGKNPEGNQINRPCEHIRIFDCEVVFGHGFAMGSEMSGGIRDVRIWNCDLRNSANGIEIKGTRKRGGFVRDVHAVHCVVPRILFHSVGYNDDGDPGPHPPIFEKCSFTDIEITRSKLNEAEERMEPCEAMDLCGFEETEYHLRDILFQDIRIAKNGQEDDGIRKQFCDGVIIETQQ